MKCPKCGEWMPIMSGVKFETHKGERFRLCFKCKCWYSESGEFLQTI